MGILTAMQRKIFGFGSFTRPHENVYVAVERAAMGCACKWGRVVASRTVTIKDVAREAKLSVASVSRALNGSGGVTPATVKTVREVAARLRYVPDNAARSMITRRTNTIGVLLPDLYASSFPS
jgi:AraC-like DNA-binding protein